MKFYGREDELRQLSQLEQKTKIQGVMTVLTGRRRVGKTELAFQQVQGQKFIYLFVSKKAEFLLCQEYLADIQRCFELPVIGEIRSFSDIFKLLLELGKTNRFTLIIDEFQEFTSINPSIYSDIQKLWDIYKKQIHLHVIFIGSIYSLMRKIFRDKKEPLFGRADAIIHLQGFSLNALSNLLKEYRIFDAKNWFDLYLLTGGMPKYVELLMDAGVQNLSDMLNVMLAKNSLFLEEGKYLLIEEFGKEYTIYFSILELIAQGKTARSEIGAILEKDIGGYLQRLEDDYTVIQTYKPMTAKPQSRLQRYTLIDNFIKFWFYYFYANRAAIEMENFSYIKKIMNKTYANYSGRILENFYHTLLAETGLYNRIGRYWEKGNLNEIDLIAVNDLEKRMVVAEIKRNAKKINTTELKLRAEKLRPFFDGYTVEYLALSLDNMEDWL